MLGISENHLGPSLNYMLDAQKSPTQTLEASFAFRRQRARSQAVFTFWKTLVYCATWPCPTQRRHCPALRQADIFLWLEMHEDWNFFVLCVFAREVKGLPRYKATPSVTMMTYHHPPPLTRLPSHSFMTSTVNDNPTFVKCWSHSVSLLSQLARNRHLAQHRGVSQRYVIASLPSAWQFVIKIIFLVVIDLLQIILT